MEGIKKCRYSNFYTVTNEQQKDNKQKIKSNLAENSFETVKPYYRHQNMFNYTFYEHWWCIMLPLINEIR